MRAATAIRIVYFLVFCCTGAWLPKLYDYCLYRGLSGKEAALVLSITPIMMFAVQPFYGFLADRLGHKKTILFSSLIAGISYTGYLFPGGTAWIIGVTILMSVFYNTLQPVLDSMALQVAKTDASFSYGSLRVFGAIGWSVTTIVTGQLIDAVSMHVIFIVAAITMLLAFLFSFGFSAAVQEKSESHTFAGAAELLKNRSLLFFLLGVLIVSTAATTIWNFYSAYMKENGATDSWVGYGLSFQGLCEIPLFYLAARIILKWGLKPTLLLTTMVTIIRLLLYFGIQHSKAVIGVELLHGISWSLFWVVCVEFTGKIVPAKWLATGQSLLYAAYFGAGAIAGNYWTEFFISKGWKMADIFLLNAGLTVVALLLFLFFIPRKLSSADHSPE